MLLSESGKFQPPQFAHMDAVDTRDFPLETRRKNGFTVESYVGGMHILDAFGDEMEGVFLASTHDFLKPGVQEDELHTIKRYVLTSDQTRIFLLSESTGSIVGFTSVFPTAINLEDHPFARSERRRKKLSVDEFSDMQRKTGEVGWSVILPEYRHKGGWSLMMDALDEYIIGATKYTSIIRIVRKEDNYSKKVASRYRGSILYKSLLRNPDFGFQIYFRTRVNHS